MQTNGSGIWSFGNVSAATLPTGTMFNFQQGKLTTPTTVTSASFVAITGLSVSITPTSSSNTVLVRAIVYFATAASADVPVFALARNGTPIGVGTSVGSRAAVGGAQYIAAANGTQMFPIVLEWLDTPASTSAITYTVQAATIASSQELFINSTSTDSNTGAFPRTVSTISVCEIHA